MMNLRDDADSANEMPDEIRDRRRSQGRRVAGAADTLANTTPSGTVH
jgi:hypothetical protein